MKTITTTAIVALTAATIGLSALAPSYAQDAAAPVQAQQQERPGFGFRNDLQGPRRIGGGDFLSFERGAEAVEIALVRLSHRIELTAEQQPLFDAFKTAALAAAGEFATSVENLRPAEGEAATTPNLATRLENGITLQAARLAALEAVQPAATAFFDSLTEEQQAQLTPQRPDRGAMPGFGKGGPRHQGQQHGGPGAPGDNG